MPVATAAIADLYPPIERGKMQGVMGAIFGIGTAAGPVLGGVITDYISWNWVFFINVPIVAISLFLIARQFPSVASVNKKRIDYLGMSVLGLFLLDLLLFFTWAGTGVNGRLARHCGRWFCRQRHCLARSSSWS